MSGDPTRCVEMSGDPTRCVEMSGDPMRCVEMSGDTTFGDLMSCRIFFAMR